MTEIDLWIWSLAPPEARQAELRQHLDEEEQLRAARFLRPRDRLHFEAARGRMREILAGYLDRRPTDLRFQTGPHGKPFLHAAPAFNLSHSDGWAALAVGGTEPLGVDIERFRPVERDLAKRFFSPAENAELATLSKADRPAGFFRCWTRKEALVKALGTGLTVELDAFDVSLSPGAPAEMKAMRLPGARAGDWSLTHLHLADDFVGALATRGPAQLTLREGTLPLA